MIAKRVRALRVAARPAVLVEERARESISVIHANCLDVLDRMPENAIDSCVTDPPYELGFMGKVWDRSGIAFQPSTWARVLRVLKPGGYLLAFGGSRTYHRIACAIEDAGFEIRDSIVWMYGQGFPKSLDVSKAIDKSAGASRSVPGPNPNHRASGVYYEGIYSGGNTGAALLTAPATDDAKHWRGWGTALKPAFEPIIMARKPLAGTVAENVTTWGTGAINVDGCRIGRAAGDVSGWSETGSKESANVAMSGKNYARAPRPDADGRWPANVILDEESAAMLDEQTEHKIHSAGAARDGSTAVVADHYSATGYEMPPNRNMRRLGDSGGASRFFYTAKVSRRERELGCESLPPRGSDGGVRNHHPTVKPVSLMRYLCRLVTPPGGVVLDPFTGSGSTGIGAVLEGFDFLGIEREAEYVQIAKLRIDAAPQLADDTPPTDETTGTKPESRRARPATATEAAHADLFDEGA